MEHLEKACTTKYVHPCQGVMHTCKKQNVLINIATAEGSLGVSPYPSNDAAVVTIPLLSR
jgi:hypothetical protein